MKSQECESKAWTLLAAIDLSGGGGGRDELLMCHLGPAKSFGLAQLRQPQKGPETQ